jgi:aryl-alcohol dehydrogenase-like predicted oxidoreductase
MITGQATAEATQAYADAHPALTYTPLHGTDLMVSQVGFGGYRVDVSQETHQQALRHALCSGINLVDTSSNYADGGSEELVGKVVAELVAAGELARESVVIVSKVGYVQGSNLEIVRARKKAGNPFANVVELERGLMHCIHPQFVADQLSRSLERLNMETIDGYLLHNPEYYLKWAHKARQPLAQVRQEYYRRIEAAFAFLADEVTQGRIRWYGISSNTFPVPADDPEFTSLEKVWQIAESIQTERGSVHHFRIVQLPMNLFETGGATEKNQSHGRSVLDFAQEKELAVLINRPLNAIVNKALVRLADVLYPNYPATAEEVSTAVDTSVQVEERFKREILPKLNLESETKRQLLEYLAVGLMLEGHWRGFGTYHNWRDVQTQFLLPRTKNAVQFLSNLENLPVEAVSWLDEYIDAVNTTLAAVSAFYQMKGSRRARQIKETVTQADAEWEAHTLSQTAVRALRTTAGIDTVLVGMRRQAYVDDILADLKIPVQSKNRDEAWAELLNTL